MIPLSIEEAKTLDLFYKHKNIAKTATTMKKANSAIVYTLQSIEQKTGIKLFDRTGYRTEFLPAGERVLEGCRKLLSASNDLESLCEELNLGWESDLQIIVEGVVPLAPIIHGIKTISEQKSPTRIHIQAGFMGEVEETFLKSGAHLMISVLQPEKTALSSVPLLKVPAFLVATKNHPLTKSKTTSKIMKEYPILTVRGSSPKLNMSTNIFEGESRFQFNDFHSKKIAIMSGLGYGWLPQYMIEEELKNQNLKIIQWDKSNKHIFHPHLYHRGEVRLGRTSKLLIHYLTKIKSATGLPKSHLSPLR